MAMRRLLIWASLWISHGRCSQREIHLAGIFPIKGVEGWQGGQACEPAANLALQDVNAQPNILPGYTLKLHWDDSGCDSGRGASVLYDLLYTKPQKVLLLAGCSTVCTTVAEAAKMWNLVTVCYGASSPALSNRQRFPTLFRTHPSATVHNPTRIRVFQMFKWSKIAILQEAEEVFSTTLNDLESRTKLANITISTRQSFLRDPRNAVANLKRQDARIIVGLFYAKAARKVLCEIYKQGLYGQKYVWFFIGWYEDNWFQRHLKEENIKCTQEEMEIAAEGHFTTEALQWNSDRYSPTDSGKTVDEFKNKLEALLRKNYSGVEHGIMPEGYLEAPLAYDAIWAVALALNKTINRLEAVNQSLDDYNYNNKAIADIILDEIAGLQFDGMSGEVAFSEETGDRIAWTKIEQLQDKRYRVVGFYDQKTDNLTWVSSLPNAEAEADTNSSQSTSELSAVVWPGGKIPQDRTIVKERLLKLNIWLYFAMSSVAVLGILIAFSLIYFNFRYGHRRIIQKSHPSSNNIMLLGIILCLTAIIPMGMDGGGLVSLPIACGASTWLLTLGFTLAFGSMFSKIWRVHRLATKTKSDSKKQRNVVPWKLWVAVGVLLAVDLLLLLVWTGVDPLLRQVHNFPKEQSPDPEEDVEIQPQLEHCKSTHHTVWLSIMYAYKGLQLLYGLFLAYETRAVKLKEINDSRLVALAIYNVVILCMITAPVILVIGNQLNAAYCFVSLSCIFCCYLSMALVFLPKIMYVRKHSHDPREKEDDERETALQELQYRELLKANEELQRKVAEKERHLNLLKKRLEEKKEAEMLKKDREEAAAVAVAEINGHEHYNSSVLRNRRGTSNGHDNTAMEEGVDEEQVESLESRGITVLRGPVPGRGVKKFGDEHVESYL